MKSHINHWYPKDETFFKVLSTAGNIRNEDANKINISNSRLKNYEKDKLIERVTYPSRHNNQQNSNQCYALTQKGKDFIKSKYGIERCQNGHAAEHNCKVAEIICGLDKQEIASVQSEWESRDQFLEALDNMRTQGEIDRYDEYMELLEQGRVSAPDITYTSSSTGEVVSIEVVTSNYKSDDIEAKEIFVQAMERDIQYVNV